MGRGQRGVNAGGEVEFGGQVVESRDGPNADRGESKGDGVLILVEFEDVVDAAKMGENADGRFAVVAKGFDDAIVANAVGLVGLQGSHRLRIYHDDAGGSSIVSSKSVWGTGEARHGHFGIYAFDQPNPFRCINLTTIRCRIVGKSR